MMTTEQMQTLVDWVPLAELDGKVSSFGDFAVDSPAHQRLSVTLPYEEGTLHLNFKDVRAFMTVWDGDPFPFIPFGESAARPSDLLKVVASRWISSGYFTLEAESSIRDSDAPWEHFWILSGARSLHVAARDDIEATWVPGTWSGGPGNWKFTAAE